MPFCFDVPLEKHVERTMTIIITKITSKKSKRVTSISMHSSEILLLCIFLCTMQVGYTHLHQCDLVVREIPHAGLGVFAGKMWTPGEVIELAIGILVPLRVVYWTELINYMEGYNSSHGLLTMGNAMLFNHVSPATQSMIRKHMSNQDGSYVFRRGERSHDILLEPNSVIFPGDQIFSHYGDDWFDDRGMVEATVFTDIKESRSFDETFSQNGYMDNSTGGIVPGCASLHTKMVNSTLVASRPIVKGEIIEVSRAILLPEAAIERSGQLGEVLWWKRSEIEELNSSGRYNWNEPGNKKNRGSPYSVFPYDHGNLRYAVLLAGRGAFYGHRSVMGDVYGDVNTDRDDMKCVGDGACECTLRNARNINVDYKWWSRANGNEKVKCNLLMMVTFVAARDIEAGETLVIDLTLDSMSGKRYVNDAFAVDCL